MRRLQLANPRGTQPHIALVCHPCRMSVAMKLMSLCNIRPVDEALGLHTKPQRPANALASYTAQARAIESLFGPHGEMAFLHVALDGLRFELKLERGIKRVPLSHRFCQHQDAISSVLSSHLPFAAECVAQIALALAYHRQRQFHLEGDRFLCQKTALGANPLGFTPSSSTCSAHSAIRILHQTQAQWSRSAPCCFWLAP